MRRSAGVTLIELMIAVAIVAILASVALPSYTAYIQRGAVAEATAALSDAKVRMEQIYGSTRDYTSAQASLCVALPSGGDRFALSCPEADLTADTFTITAVGTGSMSEFAYSINQDGRKVSTTPWTGDDEQPCWITQKGGHC